ncbi:cytochrome P450 [Nocardioides sp. KC13]|uniref:Cytochrome P450 n=1 Tax=Nocardioides turkmenicus TaxID=2711220 RepID=A0A6M1QNY0_9ACTN|nr:cytochrome P450 [Nocardioides sp. KC13]NGN91355.1 cytochrome P450 [Nocardioides sp. KC13]
MTRDLAADLLRHGYHAIPDARRRAGDPPVCPVKLLGSDALVVSGPASVRRFYDPALIRRTGAVPAPLAALLFGRGAVHGLDGEEHLQRKAHFLELLDDADTTLQDLVRRHLGAALRERHGETVSVFGLLAEVYGRAVLEWAGISVRDPGKVGKRLAAIVDGFGIAGPSYATAWAARLWANRWARGLIREARSAASTAPSPPPSTPVETIASWRDPHGDLLPVPVAAIELLNVLRPAVAVAYLGTFAVQSLDDEPRLRPGLAEEASKRHAFTQEVRRLFPFVPALAGVARQDADWDGQMVSPGQRVVLDVPGTNLDPGTWSAPYTFSAERFVGRDVDAFELVPQGGGDPAEGHRCPGEPATIAMISATVEVFATATWSVVGRGSTYPRIPARERLRIRTG